MWSSSFSSTWLLSLLFVFSRFVLPPKLLFRSGALLNLVGFRGHHLIVSNSGSTAFSWMLACCSTCSVCPNRSATVARAIRRVFYAECFFLSARFVIFACRRPGVLVPLQLRPIVFWSVVWKQNIHTLGYEKAKDTRFRWHKNFKSQQIFECSIVNSPQEQFLLAIWFDLNKRVIFGAKITTKL